MIRYLAKRLPPSDTMTVWTSYLVWFSLAVFEVADAGGDAAAMEKPFGFEVRQACACL